MRFMLRVILGGAFLWLAGFIWFVLALPRAQTPDALNIYTENAKGTGIVALTGGGGTRIQAAVNLLASRYGEKMLISGVHQETGLAALAAKFPDNSPLFDCCIELGKAAQTTTGNALETQEWVITNKYDRVILVTTDYHMPRAVAELQALAPNTQIIPFPVASVKVPRDNILPGPESLSILAVEYSKFLAAKAGHLFPVLQELKPH